MYIIGYDPRLPAEEIEALLDERRQLGAHPLPHLGSLDDLFLVWCEHCGTDACQCGTLHQEVELFSWLSTGSPAIYSLKALTCWQVRRQGAPVDLLGFARLFYGVLACDAVTKGEHKDTTTAYIDEMADVMARAIVMSCLGEARYHARCVLHTVATNVMLRKGVNIYTALGLLSESNLGKWADAASTPRTGEHLSGPGRDNAVSVIAGNDLPIDRVVLLHYAGVAKTIHSIHSRCYAKDSDAIGGPLWYWGAKLAFDFLHGKINAVMFLDQSFDLTHNNGALTNKVFCVTSESPCLPIFLDWRKEASLEDMLRAAPPSVLAAYGLPKPDVAKPREWLPLDFIIERYHSVAVEQGVDLTYTLRLAGKDYTQPILQEDALASWWATLTSKDVLFLAANLPRLSKDSNLLAGCTSPRNYENQSAQMHLETQRYAARIPVELSSVFFPSHYVQYMRQKDPLSPSEGSVLFDGDAPAKAEILRNKISEVLKPRARLFVPPEQLLMLPAARQQQIEKVLDVRFVAHAVCAHCISGHSAQVEVYKTKTTKIEQYTSSGMEAWRAEARANLYAHSPTEENPFLLVKRPEQEEQWGESAHFRKLLNVTAEAEAMFGKLEDTFCSLDVVGCICVLVIEPCCDLRRSKGSCSSLSCDSPPARAKYLLRVETWHKDFYPRGFPVLAHTDEDGSDEPECAEFGLAGCGWDEYSNRCCHGAHHGEECSDGCECDDCHLDEEADEDTPFEHPPMTAFSFTWSNNGKTSST